MTIGESHFWSKRFPAGPVLRANADVITELILHFVGLFPFQQRGFEFLGHSFIRLKAQDPVMVRVLHIRAVVYSVHAVDDAHVDVELVTQPGQSLLDRAAAGNSEDVCEKENPQLRTTAADGRTSTVTWVPASFV